ncbi:thermonuclease family protein [Candidatus Pacearchaeota archaeon]|nr:thermonuclease family protein [Candidatus Pacearchaeota archaeon]
MNFIKFLRGNLLPLIIFTLILTGYLIKDNEEANKTPVELRELTIDRVIDGDTFESNGSRFRLLGINTPEKNEYLYNEAKNFFKGFEGNSSLFEAYGLDKYGRTLGYLHFGSLIINKELVLRGLASSYYYGDDSHKKDILKAELSARNNNLGIWQKSNNPCSQCIALDELYNGANENDCKAGVEFVRLKNICSIKCDINRWLIKDSATHIYKFINISINPQSSITLYGGRGNDSSSYLFWNNKDSCASIWNDDGDNLFLRDDKGLLVYHYRY